MDYKINQTKLLDFREANKISQKEVARYMDITPGYLNEMEKGRRDMGMKYLTKYSNYLGMRPTEVLALMEEKR